MGGVVVLVASTMNKLTSKSEAMLLSICVPTFNRADLLKRMLASLDNALSQAPDLAYEVVFSDNASTDNTKGVISEFAQTHPTVYTRHETNVGVTRNILSCSRAASGEYAWMLGDDDLVVPDALARILEQLRAEPHLNGHIVCHAIVMDSRRQDYENRILQSEPLTFERTLVPLGMEATRLDRFEQVFCITDVTGALNFLSNVLFRVSIWREHVQPYLDHCENREWFSDTITAAGYMCVWAEFLAGRPVGLIATPLVVGFVGRQAIVDKWPTILTVFFLDVSNWFLQFGADSSCVTEYRRRIYGASGTIAKLIASDDPFTKRHFSLDRLVRDYGDDPFLWQSLPNVVSLVDGHLAKIRVIGQLFVVAASSTEARRGLSKTLARAATRFLRRSGDTGKKRKVASYLEMCKQLDTAAREYFQEAVGNCIDAHIRHPVYLKNPCYIRIGRNFRSGPGLRLEAWDRQREWTYSPALEIGDDVSVNFNLHIGVVQRVSIGNQVLIGSNVLITDHHHGDLSHLLPQKTFKDQPLFCPGPVAIGDNVWIGENAAILAGVSIGAGSVVGANAVVTRDVPAGSVVAGAPARVIRSLVE